MIPKRFPCSTSYAARSIRGPIPRSVANARIRTQNARFNSSSATNSGSNTSSSSSPAVIGALTGSLTTFTIGYLWYRQSGARELLTATKTTKDYVNTATQKLKESSPEPNEALKWLRQTATSYAMFIPGARAYIDAAFNDIDAIREKHGDEVDSIVREAYDELRDIAKNGDLSLLSAQKAWNVIIKHLGRIGDLSGDAAKQIMDNHPQLKDKVGGNLDKLKEMGRNYGPEAKKEVDKTWDQISDIIKTGVSAQNIEKIQKVVQEKVDKVKELGNEAWKKGMEKAKPYLDKNPTAKKLVEENEDALKSGNVQELYSKIKQAAENGDTSDLERYVKSFSDKAKGSGFANLEQYLNKFPGGDQILPKLSQLQDVAEKHGDEAQKLLKETVSELSEILKKKGDEASDLAKKAKDDSKK